MIEQKYIVLMNRLLDNEISLEERKDLDEFLNRSEEGAKYFKEISKISSFLSQDEQVIPSANIKKNILNSIDYSKYTKPERPTYFEKISRILHKKLDRKIILSFCSGAVAVLLVFLMFGYPALENENTSNISGTLVHNNDLSYSPTNEFTLVNEKVNGKIHEYSSDDNVNIDFDLISDESNQIQIYFNDDYLTFSEVIKKDNQNFKFDLKDGNIEIETFGKTVFSLEFDKKAKIIPQNSIALTVNEEKLKKN